MLLDFFNSSGKRNGGSFFYLFDLVTILGFSVCLRFFALWGGNLEAILLIVSCVAVILDVVCAFRARWWLGFLSLNFWVIVCLHYVVFRVSPGDLKFFSCVVGVFYIFGLLRFPVWVEDPFFYLLETRVFFIFYMCCFVGCVFFFFDSGLEESGYFFLSCCGALLCIGVVNAFFFYRGPRNPLSVVTCYFVVFVLITAAALFIKVNS